ncbi:hypothetical protein C0J52_13344 [Blattella germanica]|nr:hypothetical protein C0J52_13344 [Blattella germanica]
MIPSIRLTFLIVFLLFCLGVNMAVRIGLCGPDRPCPSGFKCELGELIRSCHFVGK